MSERVSFDRSLYLPEAVDAAAEAYAAHAQIDVTPTAAGLDVVIGATGDLDPQTVVHAFCNHVLYETIARRRRAALDEGA
jgi:hypothetical protein